MKYNWILMFLMFLSPFILMSMNSLINIWIMMELNLILFLTLIIMNNNNIYDMSMKYFLINSFSSSIFLFMSIMNYLNYNEIFVYMINLSMLIKLGMVPFHYWFVNMMMNLNWSSCFILSTWQKIIPLIILFYTFKINFIINFIMINYIIVLTKTMSSSNLKLIMSFSSINHLNWMLMSMYFNSNLWIIYFISYFMLNFSIFSLFNMFKLINLNDMNKIFLLTNKMNFLLLILSLSNMPPLFGFMMKWLFIYELMNLNNMILLMILIFSSMIFLYYYIRLTFNFMNVITSMTKFNYSMINNLNNKKNIFLLTLNILSIFSTFTINLIMY